MPTPGRRAHLRQREDPRRRIAAGKLRAYRYGTQVIRVDPNDVDLLMTPIRTLRSA